MCWNDGLLMSDRVQNKNFCADSYFFLLVAATADWLNGCLVNAVK